jgi:hypothetical protein
MSRRNPATSLVYVVETQFARVHASREHIKRGEDAECPPALWVDGSRELKGVRVGVGEVYVYDGDENDTIAQV